MDNRLNLIEIIQQSAESHVQSLQTDGQLLIIHLFHDTLDGVIEFQIKSSEYYSNYVSGQFSLCYLKLNPITDDLSVEHGVYIASNTFENFMYECRSGFKVAYGLRAGQFKYFLKFLGGCEIIIPIRNIEEVSLRRV